MASDQEVSDLKTELEEARRLIELQSQCIAGLEEALRVPRNERLVTIHICATEMGVSATYPEGTPAGRVVSLLWRYIQRRGSEAISRPYKPIGKARRD